MSGKFALIIGNTKYTDTRLAKLTAPGQDARDFARVLRDPELCAFDEVTVLVDQRCDGTRRRIAQFFADKKTDDLLVLYFSGHGVRDEDGRLYLATVDTATQTSMLDATAIPADSVAFSMNHSRSKRQVLILDCCNSGAFSQGTKAASPESDHMGMASALQGYGRYVLTASDVTQFAWEGDKILGKARNSLFTHFLVKGLEGEADNDGDGLITVEDLYQYTFEQVSQATPNQTPTKSASKTTGDIVLRRITNMERTKPVPLPQELAEAARDWRPFVRLGVIPELVKEMKGPNLGRARSAKELLEQMAAGDDSLAVRDAAAKALKEQPPVPAPVIPPLPPPPPVDPMESLYAAAGAALVQGNWQKANDLLQKIEAQAPDYRDTRALLADVAEQLRREMEARRQAQAAALYEQARGFAQAERWREALRALTSLRKLHPEFKDADEIEQRATAALQPRGPGQLQLELIRLYGLARHTWLRWTLWQRWSLVGGLVLLGVMIPLLPRLLSPATPVVPGGADMQLYFTSDRDQGQPEIYALNVENGTKYRVTNTPGSAGSWSPLVTADGMLYFASDREENKVEIYRMDLHSGAVTRVIHSPDGSESWSPFVTGAGALYFTSNREQNKPDIYRMDLRSGELVRVLNTPGTGGSWSPFVTDNGMLYFTSNRVGGKPDIYRMDLKSGATSRVLNTTGAASSWAAYVTADRTLYFTSNREGGKPEIYRMDLNSGKVTRVLNTPGLGSSWAPVVVSDRLLYFTSNREDNKPEIYRMDLGTGELSRMTNTSGSAQNWLGTRAQTPSAGSTAR